MMEKNVEETDYDNIILLLLISFIFSPVPTITINERKKYARFATMWNMFSQA
jgi:hypothetical protein